jgi:hypothetical protein
MSPSGCTRTRTIAKDSCHVINDPVIASGGGERGPSFRAERDGREIA